MVCADFRPAVRLACSPLLPHALCVAERTRCRAFASKAYTDESMYSFRILITSFWSCVVQSTKFSILGLDGDLDLEPPIVVGIFGSD
jgi:hypothetical protein